MSEGVLCLQWNNHKSTLHGMLHNIKEKESYSDATLACEEKFYSVHKLVLSMCSEYFENIFSRLEHDKHPIIILNGIKKEELESLLNYMYIGEVNVVQEQLSGLVKAAECLKIKGLAVPDEDANKAIGNICEKRKLPETEVNSKRRKCYTCEDFESLPHVNKRSESFKRSTKTSSLTSSMGSFHEDTEQKHSHSNDSNCAKIADSEIFESSSSSNENVVDVKVEDSKKPFTAMQEECSEDANFELVEVKKEPFNVYAEELTVEGNIPDCYKAFQKANNSDHSLTTCTSSMSTYEDQMNSSDSSRYHSDLKENCNRSSCEANLIIAENEIIKEVNRNTLSNLKGSKHSAETKTNNFSLKDLYDDRNAAESQFYIAESSKENSSLHPLNGRFHSAFDSNVSRFSNEYDTSSVAQSIPCSSAHSNVSVPLLSKFYQCPFCQYGTGRKSDLSKHLRVHTGEKPFQCSQCPYSASDASNLRAHEKKQHSTLHANLLL